MKLGAESHSPEPSASASPNSLRSVDRFSTSNKLLAAGLLAQASRGGSNQLQLRARRFPDAVELVIEGAGASPQLQQSGTASGWQGRLSVPSASGLRVGPQSLSMPEVGFQSVSFDGSDGTFTLSVEASPGVNLGRPVVSSDGRDLILTFAAPVPQARLQVNRLDMSQPGAVPLPTYAPPLQPRAVAPPLGDMAVGTITTRSPGLLSISGPPVTMTLKNAPARDALMALADLGGYGFVAIPDSQSCTLGVDENDASKTRFVDAGVPSADPLPQPLISLLFRGESYSTAFNSALRAAGWGGMIEGRTIYAGRSVVCDSFSQKVSKVIRLNQADPEAAVFYLSTLGALGKRPTLRTTLTSTGIPESDRVDAQNQTQQTTSEDIQIQVFRSPMGPLLGLEASFDARLGLVTLIGNPNVVAMGEQYLRQFDLRKRQIALAITIIDLDLSNDSTLSASFAYRSGNNFIVNDIGNLFGNIGNTGQQPPFNVPDGDFVGFLRAAIVSQNAKVLANPTLVMQEGERIAPDRDSSFVRAGFGLGFGSAVDVGSQVVTDFNVTTDSNGITTCNPTRENAGLTMLAKVDKVDDNGFVTFQVAPRISAAVGTQVVPGCGTINILNSRALATSRVRVRDGQTLILTGVISDEDRVVVTKWPILGDIPIIGSLFRSTGRNRTKRELVILVTPRLVDDEQGGVFGYGYRPTMGVRELLPVNGVPSSF